MAQGQWVNISGKGRRWQQPSGELMMTKPGFGKGEFFQTRAAELLGGVGNLFGGTPRYTPDQMRGLTAPGLSSVVQNAQQQNPALGRVSAPGTDSGWWLKGGDAPGAPATTDPGGTQRPEPTPVAQISPEERAYNEERSRIAQLTAQNPEFQNVGQLRNDLRDQGMAIWAAKHGGLAKNVKPGQSGYEAIQQQLGTGSMGAPQDMGAFSGVSGQGLLFNPSSPLASAPASGPTDYTQVAPNSFVPGMPGIGGNYFGGAANQAQASLFSRFQQNAPGGTPLPTGMNPGLAPGSPYAQLAAGGIPAYGGNTDLQGVGPSLTDEGKTAFASDKARAQAEEFKKRVLSSGK